MTEQPPVIARAIAVLHQGMGIEPFKATPNAAPAALEPGSYTQPAKAVKKAVKMAKTTPARPNPTPKEAKDIWFYLLGKDKPNRARA